MAWLQKVCQHQPGLLAQWQLVASPPALLPSAARTPGRRCACPAFSASMNG